MRAMTLRLPDEVHEALRREAFESRRSMQQIVEEAISDRRGRKDIPFYQLLAEAWNEGRDAERRAVPEKRFPVNPYREGSAAGDAHVARDGGPWVGREQAVTSVPVDPKMLGEGSK